MLSLFPPPLFAPHTNISLHIETACPAGQQWWWTWYVLKDKLIVHSKLNGIWYVFFWHHSISVLVLLAPKGLTFSQMRVFCICSWHVPRPCRKHSLNNTSACVCGTGSYTQSDCSKWGFCHPWHPAQLPACQTSAMSPCLLMTAIPYTKGCTVDSSLLTLEG